MQFMSIWCCQEHGSCSHVVRIGSTRLSLAFVQFYGTGAQSSPTAMPQDCCSFAEEMGPASSSDLAQMLGRCLPKLFCTHL